MFKSLLALVLVAGLTLPAAAQDNPEALREAAVAYIGSPAQQSVIDRLLSADNIVAQARASRPDLPQSLIDELGIIASEELGSIRIDLEAAMIDAAAETFTLNEIQALDAFYRTDEGASVLLKTQDFMQAAMQRVGPKLQEAQQAIGRRAQAAMQNAQ
jgi:hypothetical protein